MEAGERCVERGNEAAQSKRLRAVVARKHAEIESLVADVLRLAVPDSPVETAVVEYISTILRDGSVGFEEVCDLLDGVVGVAPELEEWLRPAGAFELLLAHSSPGPFRTTLSPFLLFNTTDSAGADHDRRPPPARTS